MLTVVCNPNCNNIRENQLQISDTMSINRILQENAAMKLLIVSSPQMLDKIDVCLMEKELSEHICFAYLLEKDDRAILIDSKIPYMISKIPEKHISFWDNVDDWIKNCSDYGYECSYIEQHNKEDLDKKINMLIYFGFFPMEYCGSAQHFLGEIEGIPQYDYEVNISIYIPHKAMDKYEIVVGKDINVIYVEDGCDEIFDVTFVPYQVWNIRDLYFIRTHSKQYVVWPLDIIAMRCAYLQDDFRKSILEELSTNSSGFIFSLQATADDFYDFFKDNTEIKKIPYKVISIPSKKHISTEKPSDFPFERFSLVLGNNYKHKMIEQVVDVLNDTNHKYVVVGGKENELVDNILFLKSGNIPEIMMDYLYLYCDMIIFPSIYEGFGLPIVEGINCGKNIIVPDTSSNREILNMNDCFKQYVHLYKKITDIPSIINDIQLEDNLSKPCNVYDKTWNDVMRDVVDFIKSIFRSNGRDKDCSNIKNMQLLKKCYEQDYRLSVMHHIMNNNFDDIASLKKIDIYGCGNNGKLFYQKIKDKCIVERFIDKEKVNINLDNLSMVRTSEYEWKRGTYIVVVPVYNFFEIKKQLIELGVEQSYILRIDCL